RLGGVACGDFRGGKKEAWVVRPLGPLDPGEPPRHIDQAAMAVGSRGARIRRPGVDLVAPGERGAPAIVVEGAREVMRVGGTVALGAVVRVMKVELRLVEAEARLVVGAV